MNEFSVNDIVELIDDRYHRTCSIIAITESAGDPKRSLYVLNMSNYRYLHNQFAAFLATDIRKSSNALL